MPIKGVTFDLWQTLLMDNEKLGRGRMRVRVDGTHEALGQAGEEFSENHIREAYQSCYRTCQAIRAHGRDVSFMKQIEIFIRHIDPQLMERLEEKVIKRISAVYADAFFCFPPPPHNGAINLLRGVKGKGYRLGLISNTGMTPGVTFRAYMEQTGILGYFEVLTFSDEVQIAKPAEEIFLRTARALGVTPDESIHVGDHLLNDVSGAKQAGMKAIWIETHDQRRRQVDVEPRRDGDVPRWSRRGHRGPCSGVEVRPCGPGPGHSNRRTKKPHPAPTSRALRTSSV